MKKIFKYELKALPRQTIEMPVNTEIIHVNSLFNYPCIFAMAKPTNEMAKRTFEVYGTDQEIKDNDSRKYLESCQMWNNEFILHIFEIETP